MKIDKKRVKEIINTYGGNPRNWPKSERKAAHDLTKISPDLEILYATAQKLDEQINHAPAPKIDTALERQIIAAALSHPQEQTPQKIKAVFSFTRPSWFWLPSGIGIATAAAIIGFFAGTGQLPLIYNNNTDQNANIEEQILTEEMLIFGTASFDEWEF